MTDGFKPLPEPMTFKEMIRDWWTALPSQRWACRAAGLFGLAWTFAPVIKWYGEGPSALGISFAKVVWMHLGHHIEPGYGMVLLLLPAICGVAGVFVPFARQRARLILPLVALGVGALHLLFILLRDVNRGPLHALSGFLRVHGMVPEEWQLTYLLPALALGLIWLFLEWRTRGLAGRARS